MTYAGAMCAIKKGNRVRRDTWPTSSYLYLDDNGQLQLRTANDRRNFDPLKEARDTFVDLSRDRNKADWVILHCGKFASGVAITRTGALCLNAAAVVLA